MISCRPNYIYTGSFANGAMHGKGGIDQINTGVSYSGDFIDGQITGFGKYGYPDGSSYEGGVQNGRFNGDGQFTL